MPTEHRIKTLKLRQKSIITSFTLIKTFVDDYDEETQVDEVPVRLEHLSKLWTEYNTVQSELETLDDEALETHLQDRATIESAYYRIKGFLLAHNKAELNQSTFNTSHFEARPPPSASQVRLPDVKLPVFDGQLENWLNFHDLFLSLVHSSADLSNIQKFYYLRSSLSNAALQLIQTIPISAKNYPVAWNLLLDHFQNTARLKQSYVDNLFEFATLKRESSAELHNLVEKFEANVKVLQQLGERTDHWDLLLIRMLSSRLDPTTRRDWEEHSSSQQAVTFKDLTSFIQRRVTVLQSIHPKPIESPLPHQAKKLSQRPVASIAASQANQRSCIICTDHHPLYLCERFSNLSITDKEAEVDRHQLCRNCLRKGHQSSDCLSSSTCRWCRERHHTQLCANSSASNESKPASHQQPNPTTLPSTSDTPITSATASMETAISCASVGPAQSTILLATAVISIIDDNGTEHVGRALLDSGSECCFVTERFSEHISAPRKRISQPITGIGQESTQAKTKFLAQIRSRVGKYSTNIEFLVLPKVTIDLPATTIDTSSWTLPPGIKLADPSFASTGTVDIIIGAEIFFELFKIPGRIPLGNNLPVLVNSAFGWVVCGKATNSLKPIVAHLAFKDI
ncbi:uncharacterized protein LOC134290134 [Aedes albopictus]|uniref:CCHC-type domain-containing protein n=1 Tax=Aedes albopictus TaxID=7160 RepID=A0ABM1YP94_AEDAL